MCEERGDLIQLYKFLHGIDKIEINKKFSLVKNNLTGHRFKYYKKVARVPSREHFSAQHNLLLLLLNQEYF